LLSPSDPDHVSFGSLLDIRRILTMFLSDPHHVCVES
jgi:hypothetical protein